LRTPFASNFKATSNSVIAEFETQYLVIDELLQTARFAQIGLYQLAQQIAGYLAQNVVGCSESICVRDFAWWGFIIFLFFNAISFIFGRVRQGGVQPLAGRGLMIGVCGGRWMCIIGANKRWMY